MFKNCVYLNLYIQLGDASIKVTELLRTGESLPSGSFFTKYNDTWPVTGSMLQCNGNLFFLFLKQNICCGYSKEPYQ